MKRRHLFEFEDLPWLPAGLRNMVTDVLREGVVLRRDVYRSVVPMLTKVIREQNAFRVVDLCSGSSGPWTRLKARLAEENPDLDLVFTDKYPNKPAFRAAIERIGDGRTGFEAEPVDATRVPSRLTGIRTLFTSFHHLRPPVARQVLRDAFEQRVTIAVFEFTARRWRPILRTALLAPILVWAYAPRIRPLTLPRLIFTYLIPIVPIVVTWDGVVSNLRTYSTDELADLVAGLSSPDYRWEIGELTDPHGPPVTYVIGQP
jgi:hypothetical protein